MAALAKLLGVLCVVAGVGVVLVATYAFMITDWTAMDSGGHAGDVAAGESIMFLGGMAVLALLLGAVGAGVYVIGDLAEGAALDSRARRARWEAQQQYGATRT